MIKVVAGTRWVGAEVEVELDIELTLWDSYSVEEQEDIAREAALEAIGLSYSYEEVED